MTTGFTFPTVPTTGKFTSTLFKQIINFRRANAARSMVITVSQDDPDDADYPTLDAAIASLQSGGEVSLITGDIGGTILLKNSVTNYSISSGFDLSTSISDWKLLGQTNGKVTVDCNGSNNMFTIGNNNSKLSFDDIDFVNVETTFLVSNSTTTCDVQIRNCTFTSESIGVGNTFSTAHNMILQLTNVVITDSSNAINFTGGGGGLKINDLNTNADIFLFPAIDNIDLSIVKAKICFLYGITSIVLTDITLSDRIEIGGAANKNFQKINAVNSINFLGSGNVTVNGLTASENSLFCNFTGEGDFANLDIKGLSTNGLSTLNINGLTVGVGGINIGWQGSNKLVTITNCTSSGNISNFASLIINGLITSGTISQSASQGGTFTLINAEISNSITHNNGNFEIIGLISTSTLNSTSSEHLNITNINITGDVTLNNNSNVIISSGSIADIIIKSGGKYTLYNITMIGQMSTSGVNVTINQLNILQCNLSHTTTVIDFTPTGTIVITDFLIDNTIVTQTTTSGTTPTIDITPGTLIGSKIDNLTFKKSTFERVHAAGSVSSEIKIQEVVRLKIIDCVVTNTEIEITPNTDSPETSNCTIYETVFNPYNSDGSVFYLNFPDYDEGIVSITNCDFYGFKNGSGNWVSSAILISEGQNVNIVNCTFLNMERIILGLLISNKLKIMGNTIDFNDGGYTLANSGNVNRAIGVAVEGEVTITDNTINTRLRSTSTDMFNTIFILGGGVSIIINNIIDLTNMERQGEAIVLSSVNKSTIAGNVITMADSAVFNDFGGSLAIELIGSADLNTIDSNITYEDPSFPVTNPYVDSSSGTKNKDISGDVWETGNNRVI